MTINLDDGMKTVNNIINSGRIKIEGTTETIFNIFECNDIINSGRIKINTLNKYIKLNNSLVNSGIIEIDMKTTINTPLYQIYIKSIYNNSGGNIILNPNDYFFKPKFSKKYLINGNNSIIDVNDWIFIFERLTIDEFTNSTIEKIRS